MAILDRNAILAAGRLTTEAVEVEGDMIIVSQLGAVDAQILYSDPRYQDGEGSFIMARFTPALLVRCLVDESGQRMFSDEDTATVARLPVPLFDRLCSVAMRINSLTAGAHEEQVKNSEPSPE